LVWTT